MIIDKANSDLLKQHDLFLRPNIEVLGEGFLGVRTELRTGMGAKPGPLGILSKSFLGSYISACNGYYHNISVGNYSSLADGFRVWASHDFERITSSRCTVETEDPSPNFVNFKGRSKYIYSFHSMIGHDVWCGNHVQIRNGIIIGHGAIVGAGSVVTKNVPPYAIVGGSPAKLIRMRFPEKEVERIMQSEWYLYDWQNIELDWGNRHNTLAQMEDMIAAQTVPRLGQGFLYQGTADNIKLTPATWSLEKQMEVSFEKHSLQEIFEMPEIKNRLI